MGAGLTSILALCGTTAQEDVRSLALRPSVGVSSLAALVGDRQR
jgi:ribonucleotide monophosphatase NagD (HAD superfamily)